MKTSSILFNVAAVVACLGMALALADLVRHKANMVTTQAPSAGPSPASPSPTLKPTPVVVAVATSVPPAK
jgi:hypothetical protein